MFDNFTEISAKYTRKRVGCASNGSSSMCLCSAWIRIRQTVLCRLCTKIYGNNLARARADICALNIFVMHNLSKTHLRYNYAMSQNWVATISEETTVPFVF